MISSIVRIPVILIYENEQVSQDSHPGGPMDQMRYLPMVEILVTDTYPNAPVPQDSHPGGVRPELGLVLSSKQSVTSSRIG